MGQATVSVDRDPSGHWNVRVIAADGRTWTYTAASYKDAEECVCAAIRGVNHQVIRDASEQRSTLPR
jgi:hypothetical protein